MKINIPKNAKYIIDKLYENGYEAFVVGGCVRDSLLGKEPKDWDITTSASPYEVKKLFRRTIDTGIKHGTVTVMLEKEGYEVTTYRVDGDYVDCRHPEEVTFTSNLQDDLQRRDFTINAMAYNDKEGLVDCFEGESDLKKRIIRCVGDPKERFNEDALRILRAVRFSAQLDFDIDNETKKAITLLCPNLQHISAERIKAELDKMLLSNCPSKILVAYELGITKYILPEFDDIMPVTQENPHHMYNVGIHTVEAMKFIVGYKEYIELEEKEKLILMWAILMHDFGKKKAKTMDSDGVAHFKKHSLYSVDIAKNVLLRLKSDNYTQNNVLKIIQYHDYRYNKTKVSLRRATNKVTRELMGLLFLMQRADTMGQNVNTIDEKIANLDECIKIYNEIEFDCVTIKDLAINGNDLIQNGVKPGKNMGDILKTLLDIVIEDPQKNTKEYLLQKALEYNKSYRK